MAIHNIDHVQVAVSDYDKAKTFYVNALQPLGWVLMMEFPMGEGKTAAGFGTGGKPFLWLSSGTRPSITGHVAFGANNAEQVNGFYEAAIASGGTDNGPPGIRHDYHPKYYAAFVRDPDGNNIEAVWHGEEEETMPEKTPARRRAAPAKKAATRTTAAKKPTVRRAAPAAKKPATRTATAKKPASRVAAAKKPAARTAAAKKPAAPRKPAARKPAAKQPTRKAAAARRAAPRGRSPRR